MFSLVTIYIDKVNRIFGSIYTCTYKNLCFVSCNIVYEIFVWVKIHRFSLVALQFFKYSLQFKEGDEINLDGLGFRSILIFQ